eukprot:gene15851-21478_t
MGELGEDNDAFNQHNKNNVTHISSINLESILRSYYCNSKFNIDPSEKMLSELECKRLVLSDTELTREDVAIICSFLLSKEVLKSLESIEVSHHFFNNPSKLKNLRRRPVKNNLSADCRVIRSSLNENNFKLLRSLIIFIQSCPSLRYLSFESVAIPYDSLAHLASAIETRNSVVWISLKNCWVGDKGLKSICPYLVNLKSLRVLILESCGLTDKSLTVLARYFKEEYVVFQNVFDDNHLRWNNNTPYQSWNENKQADLYTNHGIVALSLKGNNISGDNIEMFCNALHNNSSLLGLDLSNNFLDKINMNKLFNSLSSNFSLLTLLVSAIPNNNSYLQLWNHLTKNRNEKQDELFSGQERLDALPHIVRNLLMKWMTIQQTEIIKFTSKSKLSNNTNNNQMKSYVKNMIATEKINPFSNPAPPPSPVSKKVVNYSNDNNNNVENYHFSHFRSTNNNIIRFDNNPIIIEPNQSYNNQHITYTQQHMIQNDLNNNKINDNNLLFQFADHQQHMRTLGENVNRNNDNIIFRPSPSAPVSYSEQPIKSNRRSHSTTGSMKKNNAKVNVSRYKRNKSPLLIPTESYLRRSLSNDDIIYKKTFANNIDNNNKFHNDERISDFIIENYKKNKSPSRYFNELISDERLAKNNGKLLKTGAIIPLMTLENHEKKSFMAPVVPSVAGIINEQEKLLAKIHYNYYDNNNNNNNNNNFLRSVPRKRSKSQSSISLRNSLINNRSISSQHSVRNMMNSSQELANIKRQLLNISNSLLL